MQAAKDKTHREKKKTGMEISSAPGSFPSYSRAEKIPLGIMGESSFSSLLQELYY